MTSGYPYSPRYNNDNNRNPNPASTPNSNPNNHSLWNNDSLAGRGEETESLTLPPISRANPENRLELPATSSSPLFVSDSHTGQTQPEQSSHSLDSRSNASAMILGAVSASTATTTTNSNSEPSENRTKRPRSSSPPDLFSFDPFDETIRYRSPPPLPPSNQNSRPPSQPGRGSSFYDDDAEALTNFDWDTFLSQDNENDEEIDDPFASPPQIPSRASDSYGVVDLTDSSPAMVPPPERRRALSGTSLRPAALTRPKSPKRRKPDLSKSTPVKRRKLSPSETKPEEDVEVVDLAENSNLEEYEAAKAKRQEDLIKQQNQDEATKPVKLVEFQCIICMDNPTDLTVTHCGHLFCSECLHSALHAGNNGRKSCPVCRTSISTTSLSGRRPPKNGTFSIAIKLMTANKMGKKPKRN
ncbi:uncharacterized protein EAF01_003083 [Botrytis porri]|uniref:RING-type domain-containing protein n=1 Tax=Botrytis porri TaxID=87229 RepID=A0A4Z1L2X0_9HELO|nr:uncharacterized protein EAF01_003083 [Botrytis porri]KAF7909365.1 hypothetical protein EAF01_003083 [Botrytis porri]TGO91182.1 hypothetical protein BPOR_0036g00120 [Botrytis porri]